MNTLSITNPRTGQADFELSITSEQAVSEIASKAKHAQLCWWSEGLSFRIGALLQLAKLIEQNKASLVEALCQDTGRYNESVLEVDGIVGTINRWCSVAPDLLEQPNERRGEIPFLAIQQSYLPYPLVGVISPWNFPLLLSLVDAIPAMLAGSTIIIKPSEFTSRFVAPLQQLIDQIPSLAGVLNIATGDGSTGAALIASSDLICFTGSVATGRKVGEACAKRFIPSFLELGGKDPAIVCKDADIKMAAKALCWGSMVNGGQSCMSIERVYVHRDIADSFISELVAHVEKLTHNYPEIDKGQVGPIISPPQVDIVKAQLSNAKQLGATFLTGGDVINLGGGSYCQPTVITNVSENMQVLSQESFAAILPVVIVNSDQEAVTKANASEFGLSAAVFSQSIDHANDIAAQLEAGAVSINDASLTALVHEAEKQSFKHSGLGGSRMGNVSITRFMRKKAFIRNTGVESPWWF